MNGGTLRRLALWGRRMIHVIPAVKQDEGLWVLALGVVATVAPLILGVTVLLGALDMDGRLYDAGETGHRLSSGQVDDNLTADLIKLQRDETVLFQSHVNYGQLANTDPRADERQVEVDVAIASSRIGGSGQARSDLTLITGELPDYMDLGSTALADNQQGLPVGAAYLRAASSYLRQQMLPRAADIRTIEQKRLRADAGQAEEFPWLLIVVLVVVLGCLVFTHRDLTRRTHRQRNRGLLVACAVVLALGAGAVTTTLLSQLRVSTAVQPRATTAIDLTVVQNDANQVELDDELTISDHAEDCLTSAGPDFQVHCENEQDALDVLKDQHAMAHHLDAVPPKLGARMQTVRKRWLTAELKLPTLQNLANQPATQSDPPRYDGTFLKYRLPPYTDPAAAPSKGSLFNSLRGPVLDATRQEWSRYAAGVHDARAGLGILAWTGLVLGLAAGTAAGLGCRPIVIEYWSRGRSTA